MLPTTTEENVQHSYKMNGCTNPEPRWVIVDDAIHHVSDFAHLAPRQRPAATCPICSNPAILKLGKKRTHHYCHEAGTHCPLSNRETELHTNTKFHLYRELKKGREVRIEIYCQDKCGTIKEPVWACDWTNVEVEYKIDAVRPDIVLLKNGVEIGAIEIFATHAVDAVKTEYLAQKKLPWLEIRATTDFYDGDNAWSIEKALPFHTLNPAIEFLCDKCQAKRVEASIKARQAPPKSGICQFCGVVTEDWWSFDGITNTCKCKSCYKHGKH
jgi:hypothetical protein